MLRQLRRKFILINMLFVSLVLVIVVGFQIAAAWQQVEQETDSALRLALQWGDSGPDRWFIGPRDQMFQPEQEGETMEQISMVPAFCVVLDGNGEVVSVQEGYNVEVSDAVLEEAVAAAAAAEADRGNLTELNLRYLRDEENGGLRIAFADLSWSDTTMRQQVLNAVLVLAAALVGFFLISLFLSRWALKPVERSWQQQQQFVADASHELKTPLTVLLADANILLAHPDDTIGSQRKWVEYIQDEAARMKGLVEDLLFLARSDSAADRDRERLPVALSDLCWSSLLSFEPVAFERGAELRDRVDPDIVVRGDQEQLRRLVTILLDNACKYCGPGGTVTLTLTRSGERAALSVHNTGEPIAPEALPHLFERFYRADSARDQSSGGYGLGLAIAASIAEQHHGKISAESAPETGTTFLVTLPL